jgi:hypothetical protein
MLRSGMLLTLLVLSGCNQILGIEVQEKDVGKRDAGGDAGEKDAGDVVYTTPDPDECTDYCDTLQTACKDTSNTAAFAMDSYCRGLCPFMQRTEDKSKVGNTFDCRQVQAQNARQNVGDNERECKSAGAGGNKDCGSDCEGYCQLFAAVCADYPDLLRGDTCVSECEKLVVDKGRDATAAFGSSSDTLQCRLAHVGAASVSPTFADTHCPHAAISVTTEYTPCVTPVPRCEDYCALAMSVCTGDIQQYDTEADCVAECKGGMTLNETPLRSDEPIDISRDTVACRRYHLYNHLKTPGGVHCEHAGPSGDGHCGNICPAYCKQVKAACGTQFSTAFTNDQGCLDDCGKVLGKPAIKDQIDDHYRVSTGKKGGNTMSCRIYHMSKAFLDSKNCPSAVGEGDCQ